VCENAVTGFFQFRLAADLEQTNSIGRSESITSSVSQPLLREEVVSAKPARKALLSLVRLGIGLGLVAYLAESKIISFQALSNLFTAWPITLAAVALLFFDASMMALRLTWLFRPQGLHLSWKMAIRLTLVGCFFTTFLPGAAGGDVAKLFYASRENGGRKTEIVTVVIFDRFIGLFSMLLLPLLFAPMFLKLIESVGVLRVLLFIVAFLAAGLLAALMVCLFSQGLVGLLERGTLRFSKWRGLAVRTLETMGAYRRAPGILVKVLVASMLANLSLIAVTAFAVLAVNPSGLAMKMCLVIPMGYIANSLPLTPGGLGVGEAAFNALFHVTGLRGGAEALLCWRIWSALIGLLGLGIYLRGLRGCIFDTAGER
jgi:uncharacterized protein (TIRG00374 family)